MLKINTRYLSILKHRFDEQISESEPGCIILKKKIGNQHLFYSIIFVIILRRGAVLF